MLTFKQILVPLDGSVLAEKALPVATSLAQKFDSQIILLRSVDIPSLVMGMSEPGVGYWAVEAETQLQQEAETYLAAKQAELQEQGHNVRTLLRQNAPAEEILDAASSEGVDLIVMSTHGRGGVARWAFGSVADKVARHSLCPILLVRENMPVDD